MNKSVIVHGPMACGKTRNAEKLRKFFKLDRVFDDWNGHTPFPSVGMLVLTNVSDGAVSHAVRRHSRIIPYDVAAKAAGISS